MSDILTWQQQRAVAEHLRRTIARGLDRIDRAERMVVAVVRKAVAEGVGARVAKVMARHAKTAHPDGPHSAFVAGDGDGVAVHHMHHRDADINHLVAVKEDIMEVPGVKACYQGQLPPYGAGWSKIFECPPREKGTDEQLPSVEPPAGDMVEDKSWPWTRMVRKSLDAPCTCATAAEILRGCRC
jgi:hypothetical protein